MGRTNMLFIAVSIIILMYGCNTSRVMKSTPRSQLIDNDFSAKISTTSNPYIFRVDVTKVNSKVQKSIAPRPSRVGLVVKDSSGKTLTRPDDYRTKRVDISATGSSLSSQITLYPKRMPPGTYVIVPDVKIVEEGKDAIRSDREDFGSVDVPAVNSVTITIK